MVDYLLDHGVHRINLLVLTHPQADHIGSLPQVLSRFPVDLILDSGVNADTKIWRKFRSAAIRNGARWEIARAGDKVGGLGNVRLDVLHPRGPRNRRFATKDTNEDSVVLLVSWRDFQIILTGDIGFPSEENLFGSKPRAKTTVLKVPHHGSRFSSSWEFIEDAEPVIAVAEVGRNLYGHPHERTMRRYRGMGVLFFRTDWDGTTRITSNGSDAQVVTMRRNMMYDSGPAPNEI